MVTADYQKNSLKHCKRNVAASQGNITVEPLIVFFLTNKQKIVSRETLRERNEKDTREF